MGRAIRALAILALVVASAIPSSSTAAAATAPFLSLPVDGDPFIPFYVYDPWTLRMALPTYSNITLGIPYEHSGTDYSVPQGTPVYATAAGVILSAQDGFADGCNKTLSDGGGAGNNIWIRHANGFVTAYYHLQPGSVTQFVKPGQAVQAGQQIARSSNTGNTFGGPCGGFHLHFEVRDALFRVANPYNTDTGYLFLTNPPTRACVTAAAAAAPAPTTSVEQRIADFWARIDALQPGDCVSAPDLGQWALNVIGRNPLARTTVADFRLSTAAMQGGMDRAGLSPATPTTPAPTANVEQRIADFWTRINDRRHAGRDGSGRTRAVGQRPVGGVRIAVYQSPSARTIRKMASARYDMPRPRRMRTASSSSAAEATSARSRTRKNSCIR